MKRKVLIKNIKIQNVAVLIEFLAGSGFAIFFHRVFQYPEAAYTIFSIGILLSLATYLLRENIENTREKLLEQYHQAHELTFAIARISDPECQSKAHELIESAMRTILLLQQGYIPMDETEFNLEGAKQME
jgi:ABC-type iron transport system FetAB permease component